MQNRNNKKFSERDIKNIKILLDQGIPNFRIAKIYKCSPTTISKIKNNKSWSDIIINREN